MKHEQSVTIRKAMLAVLALLALGPLASQAPAQPHDLHAIAAGSGLLPDRIEGVWNADVEIIVCEAGHIITAFDAMALFARGGTFHDTNATDPAMRSAAFGTWRRVGGRTYEFAFKFFRFEAGAARGWQVIRHTVVLSRDANSYVSEGTAEFYDESGNLFMQGCSKSTATRFE